MVAIINLAKLSDNKIL